MNCNGAKKVIFLYIDNEMGEELHLSFKEHVSLCPRCAQRIEYTRWWLAVVRSSCGRVRAPERLRRRILTSLPHRRGDL
jgi:mycothiol system anti-sigma-R factor